MLLALAGWLMPVVLSAQGITPADYPGPMQLTQAALPAKSGADVYIVRLRQAGAASYKGGTSGFSSTKPDAGQRFDSDRAEVRSYVSFLERSHDGLLAAIGGGEKLYSFRYALNGFAARLTPAEVTRLARRPEVAGIWRDQDHTLATINSSLFLGLLDQRGGLRADLGLTGEDVIVAVIDSGIDPTHPALADTEQQVPRTCRSQWAEGSWLGFLLCRPLLRDPPTEQTFDAPAGFSGICQAGEGFSEDACNNKLIGARYYNEGFLLRHELDQLEVESARDVDGHGTHIATIVAGNPVTASLFGARIGELSGIAPRARIAVYKACWLKPGDTRATCTSSDLARAIDDAVADGVDIINYSIGSLDTDLTVPESIALLNAVDAGVLSVVAAGNNGPENFTLGSPGSAPWALTVAASTQTGTRYEQAIDITAPATLAGPVAMREASFTPPLRDNGPVAGAIVPVDDGQTVLSGGGAGTVRDACEAPENAAEISGAIALIQRGGCTFQLKLENVQAAGAIGAVVYATGDEPIIMNGEANSVSIPAVMIGLGDGNALIDSWEAGENPTVLLDYGLLADFTENGDQMAAFSSRGPALSESDFIKPDITAPGVNIVAGSSPGIVNGIAGEYYQYRSGTSMSAPMVAGIAALLKEAEPDWSPSAIKSALMTTAITDVRSTDASFYANPFDMGSGRVDGNLARDPGLVYQAGFDDYRSWLCGIDAGIDEDAVCDELLTAGYTQASENLNLPSVGVTELIPGDEIVRRATNIGPASTYTVSVDSPPGMTITATPGSISLNTGETAEFRLEFDVTTAPYNFWQFGSINWSDGSREVRSPVAAQPVLMRAPRELELTTLSGDGELNVDFGYGGSYVAAVHGLHAPGLRESGVVADDPDDNFTFRFDGGVSAHFFNLGENELYLRVSLFDALTDGEDDLDLYLYHCPTLSTCTEVGKSGSFTSDEHIDLLQPEAGLYTILVHGFQTDQIAGGAGANYEVLAWSFGPGGDQDNFRVTTPDAVATGDRLGFPYDWGPLDADTIYLGGVSHTTPFDTFFLTVVSANTPD